MGAGASERGRAVAALSSTPSAYGVSMVARGLTIMSRLTSKREPWQVFDEQVEAWRLMEEHRYLLLAKARKIGISTACELYDVLWTMVQDKDGNRVRCVIAIDTDTKAQEHAAQVIDFCSQLKIKLAGKNAHGVTFPNGSQIECITAGGEDPGRGGQVHRLHVTELPFWAKPQENFQALRSSCADTAAVVIETTMNNRSEWVVNLWDGAKANVNEFHAHFWRTQSQASYRSDVKITDAEWQTARSEGFTDRRAAAWWLKEALPNKCTGSWAMLLHDFPQKEEHLFASDHGRVITVDPPLAVVDGHLEVHGLRGDTWAIEVYGEHDYLMRGTDYVYDDNGKPVVTDTRQIADSGQVVITVDTAYGVKKTNSIVLAVDKKSRRPLACFHDNTILHDDLARVAMTLRDFYKTKRPPTMKHIYNDSVTLVVEDDGIGSATCTELMTLGCPHERFHQGNVDLVGNSNASRCITAAKTHIEAGMRGAPSILRAECRELVRDEKQQLKGRKDCVMMYGMANVIIDERPYQAPRDKEAEKERAQRMSFEDSLREHLESAGGSGTIRPPWGS